MLRQTFATWIPGRSQPDIPGYDALPGTIHLHTERLPLVVLRPASAAAGLHDLQHRCGWAAMNWPHLPEIEADWRLLADPATTSLRGLTHIDGEGQPDIQAWLAAKSVELPTDWWGLLDRMEYALIVGPGDSPGDWAADSSRDVAAVLARFSTAAIDT